MKIYGLYGKSGTGKSYQALHLAYRLRAEGIIDDGLFIYGNQVVAGISAKREKTKIGAIRTALFVKDELCREVKEKIEEMQPARLLVLGTSENMVKKIVQRLELPEPVIWIPIEQITTEKERERAHSQRKEKGKHVIPAPTFQIKRQFSGYVLDPLRIFRSFGGSRASEAEKSVVRPTYSYLGEYDLSDRVISDIVQHLASQTPGVAAVMRVLTNNRSDEGVDIDILAVLRYGGSLIETAKLLQNKVTESVEDMTALNITAVNVHIRGLVV